MNNEEKILSILDTMAGQLVTINGRLENLEAGQAELTSKVINLEAGQAKLEAGQAKLEAGQANLEANMLELNHKVTNLEAGQLRLESAVAEHDADLEFIRGAVARIETDHGRKLDAVFDGYKQVYDTAVHIEKYLAARDGLYLSRLIPSM